MNALDLFATLVIQRCRVRRAEYSSLPAYGALMKASLIEEIGVVSSIICDECSQSHETRVVYQGEQYGHYCPDFGFVSKARSELIATQPNLSAFVAQIADGLTCKRRKSSPLDKDIWRIGALESHAGDVVIYMCPSLQHAQDVTDFQSAVTNEIKSPFGIMLTVQGTLTVPPYVTARLQDVLSIDPITGTVVVIENLCTIAGVPKQRTGGRPNDYRKPLGDLIALRASQGRTLQGRNAEAKALQAEFKAQHPNAKCPSLPTVRKYVSEVRSGS
ncbi:hypothetical protein ROLI_024090 [Roseobacter fucihabitans]|uniref:Uncharacterized protein n=1 Tax=Roseobacter fucihabitans TaxID=1537242 RepID=A0ABZ2BUC3_9RHOB|nr:hypothetical protein [Roseobacter litoralis]MBC6968336.1 hypothetical protein [Roseobacter litoralis]